MSKVFDILFEIFHSLSLNHNTIPKTTTILTKLNLVSTFNKRHETPLLTTPFTLLNWSTIGYIL